MAKNVLINGVTYNDVPFVNIPLAAGGGNAKFVDTDSGDAVAGDIRSGKKAWVDGNEVTGNVPVKSASDVTVSGKNVTTPAGIYDSAVTKSVADGDITPSVQIGSGSAMLDDNGEPDEPHFVIAPVASVSDGYVSGNRIGNSITKWIKVQSKQIAPSTSVQTVTPDSDYLLKSVYVTAVDVSATATEATVPAGVTFFAGSLTRRTGTATFPTVAQDVSTKVLSIS